MKYTTLGKTHIMVSRICVRFYDRQFIMREPLNTNIAQQFERELSAYVNAGRLTSEGIPSQTPTQFRASN